MPFLAMPTHIFFDQLLISINLYQYAKSQAISLFYTRNVVYMKILQFDWPRAFRPRYQIWDLCRNVANNISFHHRPNCKKKWPNFPANPKNLTFGAFLAHFLHFLCKKKTYDEILLSRTTFYGFLTACEKLEITNDPIPRKHLDGQAEGWTGPVLEDPSSYCQVSKMTHLPLTEIF